jgi:putative Mg2+ transporter-C (MgtC) family protein
MVHTMDAFTDLSWNDLSLVASRLTGAVVLASVIGWEREVHRRAAGLRTHILVAVGCAAFTTLAMDLGSDAGMAEAGRIIQGVATGVGFLGAGTILKNDDEKRIRGLTTAASIWATAAVGVAVGAGRLLLALVLVALTLVTLAILPKLGSANDSRD